MKFKMAPNSLFAILLRSPWWISLLVALGLAMAARALLPENYWAFGAMGAFPFLCIAVVAGWRQMRAPSSQRTQAILSAVAGMPWRDFARALETAFTRDGYTVTRMDGAADMVLSRAGSTTLVCAKRWKAARHGEDALQALQAAATAKEASACIYIALGELSDQATRIARQQGVQLMQGPELLQLLQDLALPSK
ncbi:MAG: restriction endonuclease [Ramlibacter sp.]|nr:restriction endonuclease [Ramlibacter sp.]